jgi:hypothetical protein
VDRINLKSHGIKETVMRIVVLILSVAAIASALAGFAAADEAAPRLALQVVRLKPGESKFVEVALPSEDFRPAGRSGRSDLAVDRFPAPGQGGAYVPVELRKTAGKEFWKAGPHRLANGVEVCWSEDRPGVLFRSGKAAQPGHHDIRVRYTNFGGKEHMLGFRVVISAE